MIYQNSAMSRHLIILMLALFEATKLQWYRRLLIIKLSATEHMSMPKLARMFNLSDASVRSYIHEYNDLVV